MKTIDINILYIEIIEKHNQFFEFKYNFVYHVA